jgi:phosphoglycerol transferase
MTQGLRTAAGYALAVLLSVALLITVMELWRADLSVPLFYAGDAFVVLAFVKAVAENGWFLHNGWLGAPWALDFHDYPTADNLHFGLMKLLSLAVADPIRVANIYFLLTFPLTVATSLFVLRRFRVAWGPAVAVSVLYAFLPYHFERHLSHLFLAAYYLIPPTLMVLLWIAQDRPVLWHTDATTGRRTLRLRSFETIASLIVCGLVASAGLYYAIFACFFLLVTGLYTASVRRRLYPLLTCGALIGVLAAGVVLNVLPTLLYPLRHGTNFAAVARLPGQAEVFGLNISHLLLPIRRHRLADVLPYFAHDEGLYGVSLGVIGGLGFLFLVARFCLVPRHRADDIRTMDLLSVLTGCGALLATAGSFGFLFNLLVSPWVRCYYRMAIYLGFFALFAVALFLDRLARRAGRRWWSALGFHALLALLLVGGVLDQTGPLCQPPYEVLQETFQTEDDFVRLIEASLPAGAMVFQLPYVPFPEATPLCRLHPYDHLRPYLHSRQIHWSFGAYRARAADRWQSHVSHQPPAVMVESVTLAGFSGIFLNRNGYPDAGAALEKRLAHLLGADPKLSNDGRWAFFSLAAYRERLQARLSAPEWDAARRRVFDYVGQTWSHGFSFLEGTENERWRWCAARGELHLDNPTSLPRQVTVEAAFSTGHLTPAHLWIESDLGNECLEVRLRPRTEWHKTLTLPPGEHTLRFRCDAERVEDAAPRVLVFRVHNFRVTPLESP